MCQQDAFKLCQTRIGFVDTPASVADHDRNCDITEGFFATRTDAGQG
jgi:hypothetical protein